MRSIVPVAAAAAAVLTLALAGCGEPAYVTPPGGGHAHVHAAPHGGTLVVLEDEACNLELLLDTSTGKLTAWVLDGHAEKFVKIWQESIELTVTVGDTAQLLRLDAVPNELTGETKSETSQFAGQSDSLRGAGEFSGVVRSVRVGDRAFAGVPFRYAGAPR